MTEYEKVMIEQMYRLNAQLNELMADIRILRIGMTKDRFDEDFIYKEQDKASFFLEHNYYKEDYLIDKDSGNFNEDE
jgi:hypothetical protein